jgi:hypothetical protein
MKKSFVSYYKDLFYHYQNQIIGLLSIFVVLWLIFYAIPSLFLSLFHTFLGNIILLISVLLISISYSVYYGIIIGIILIILYQISHPSVLVSKESFWTPESTNTFLQIQNTINRNKNFDVSVLEKQASQKEVDYFNKHGMWPWSKRVKDWFIAATNRNTYIRSYPPDAMMKARTVYNENAIQQVLSSKVLDRGIILQVRDPDLTGFGDFGYTSGLITNITNPNSEIIRKDYKTGGLEKIKFLGYGGILGEQVKQITPF